MTDNRSPQDETAESAARLVIRIGPDRGKSFALPPDAEVVLGRSDTCDIVLRDAEVSRRHCSVRYHQGVARVQDLGAANGTFLNGQKCLEGEWTPGAELRVGQTVLDLAPPHQVGSAPTWVGTSEPAEAAPPAPDTVPAPAGKAPPPASGRSPRRRRLAVAAVLVLLVAGLAVAYPTLATYLGAGTRRVTVDSTPARAEVYLNNRFVGVAPVAVEVNLRRPNVLRLVKPGSITQRMRIDRATPSPLRIALEPEALATLVVSASHPDTEVYLNGRFVGKTGGREPLRIPDVRLGPHDLRLQRPNYIPYHERIDVTRSGNISVHARLQSRQATSILNLIATQPQSALLYTELGHAHMVHKQLDKAMEAYQTAFQLVYSGKDTSNYRRRLNAEVTKILQGGQGLFNYGNEEERRVACEKLEDVFVALSREYPAAKARLMHLGKYYTNRNEIDAAVRLYRKMITTDPQNLNLYSQVASLSMNRNDHEAAIAVLRQADEHFPGNWAVHYRLGAAYTKRAATDLSANDRQQAIQYLTSALELCNVANQKRNIVHYLDQARELKLD